MPSIIATVMKPMPKAFVNGSGENCRPALKRTNSLLVCMIDEVELVIAHRCAIFLCHLDDKCRNPNDNTKIISWAINWVGDSLGILNLTWPRAEAPLRMTRQEELQREAQSYHGPLYIFARYEKRENPRCGPPTPD